MLIPDDATAIIRYDNIIFYTDTAKVTVAVELIVIYDTLIELLK